VVDDERSRLAEASWALYAQGAVTVVVDGLLASRPQSRIWRLEAVGPDGTAQYAVKWFRPDDGTADRVARDYAALGRLAQALDTVRTDAYAVRCPLPVQAWSWGYAMSAVSGRHLDDALARRQLPSWEQPRLARDLVAALAAYHATHNSPHGDFHPGNVLLGPARDLYLLNPAAGTGLPRSWPQPAVPPPLAVDIAYWTFRATLEALRRSIRHPRAAAECRRFAGVLGQAAVDHAHDPSLTKQIDHCLADHWARFRRQGLRHRLTASLASAYFGTAPVCPAHPTGRAGGR
jgi:hypothetical protein